MLRIGIAILLLLPAFAALPGAHACHAGTWADGPHNRAEVLGVGPNAVGVYTRDRTWQEDSGAGSAGCEGQSWAQRCAGEGGQTTVGAVVVPEVRVLGQTVVPETQVLPPTTIPRGIPSAGGFTGGVCATVPIHVGVYVAGIVHLDAGTDTPLLA